MIAEGRLMVSVCMISDRGKPSVSVIYVSTEELRSSGHSLGNNKGVGGGDSYKYDV